MVRSAPGVAFFYMIVFAALPIFLVLISAAVLPKSFLASREELAFDLLRRTRSGAWAETAAAFPRAPGRALSFAAAQSLDAAQSWRLHLGSVGSRVARA